MYSVLKGTPCPPLAGMAQRLGQEIRRHGQDERRVKRFRVCRTIAGQSPPIVEVVPRIVCNADDLPHREEIAQQLCRII